MRLVGPAPQADDAVTRQYVDDLVAAAATSGGGTGGAVSLLDAYVGPWAPGTYQAGNVVSHNGSTYMANTATSTEPAVAAGNPWALLAAGLHFTGPWDPAGTYQLGDIVTYGGGSYVGLQLITAGNTPAGDAYWASIAEPGSGGGPGGGYVHAQPTAGSVWTINHQLGYDPAGCTVITADGDTIDGAVVQYLSPGVSLRLSFDLSIAGTAYLS